MYTMKALRKARFARKKCKRPAPNGGPGDVTGMVAPRDTWSFAGSKLMEGGTPFLQKVSPPRRRAGLSACAPKAGGARGVWREGVSPSLQACR